MSRSTGMPLAAALVAALAFVAMATGAPGIDGPNDPLFAPSERGTPGT
jgi:hypothetical protein